MLSKSHLRGREGGREKKKEEKKETGLMEIAIRRENFKWGGGGGGGREWNFSCVFAPAGKFCCFDKCHLLFPKTGGIPN